MENNESKTPKNSAVNSEAVTNKSSLEKQAPATKPVTPAAKISPIKPTKPTGTSDTQGLKPKVSEINKDLNKNLVLEDDSEEKKKKKKFLLIIFFIILGIALLGVIIYFISNIPEKEIDFTIVVDSEIKATFEDEHGEIKKITYYPGDLISGKLKIKIDDLNNTGEYVYLRFKIGVEVNENYYAGLFEPWFTPSQAEDWYGNGAGTGEVSADNYYYYCGRCYDNFEIEVFDYLDFIANRHNNALNGKEGKIIFTVEILEGNYFAIGQEWNTAPEEWRTIVN